MPHRRTDGAAVDPTSQVAIDPPSTRVACRLAEECDAPIEGLRPLADSIDPEALDALFDGRTAADAAVRFRHEGVAVTVTGDGDVLVGRDAE